MASISVIIPVYNGAKYIEKCLRSVAMQGVEMEVVIINDASNDNLAFKLEEIQSEINLDMIYMEHMSRKGPGESRNDGVRMASGDYIAFLDADDWWEMGKVKRQISVMQSGASFSYTGRRTVCEKTGEERIVHAPEQISFHEILTYNPVTCSSVFMERGLAMEYPMPSGCLCEDYMAWIQMLKDGIQFFGIYEPLTGYLVRKGSASSNKAMHAIRRWNTYKASGIKFSDRFFYSIEYAAAKLKEGGTYICRG